jgi:hypothetical protein
MSDRDPIQKRLLELFVYRDGSLFNKTDRGRSRKGERVGWLQSKGYERLKIDYKEYYVHRLVWIMHNGDIEEGLCIDHENGIRDDNRIENLRLVNYQENAFNRQKSKGYYWHKASQKYIAQIWTSGIKIYLGSFDLEEDAIKARADAKEKYHIIENH